MRWLGLIDKHEVNDEFPIILVGLDHCHRSIINWLFLVIVLNFLGNGIHVTLLGMALAEDEEGVRLIHQHQSRIALALCLTNMVVLKKLLDDGGFINLRHLLPLHGIQSKLMIIISSPRKQHLLMRPGA